MEAPPRNGRSAGSEHCCDGEPQIPSGDQQSATICDKATGHRIWSETKIIAVLGGRAISQKDWDATQSALSAGTTPPVWFDFLFDSKMRIKNRDLVGAVLSLAIALETNIRFIFFGDLARNGVDPVIAEVVDLTNVRALLSRLKRTRYWNSAWAAAADLSAFNQLLDLRNDVIHLAKSDGLNDKELRKMHSAVKTFAYFTSKCRA